MEENTQISLPDEIVIRKIYLIRGMKVMLDMDLAELYGVETKQLKRAVRRNEKRFPSDFMFELNQEEFAILRHQFGTSSWGGVRYLPMAFTEQGVAMLSSVLNSERAILVNIQIIRIFTRMREMLLAHKELMQIIDKIEKKLTEHDDKIMLIFEYMKQLEKSKQQELEQKNRSKIGFKSPKQES